MSHFTVTIEETGETYRCSDQHSLLAGMEALGRKGIPVGCRGGGCGVCKVEVLDGAIRTRAMSREHVSVDDEAGGRVLACRATPQTDIRLRVLGKMKRAVCQGAAAVSTTTSQMTGD